MYAGYYIVRSDTALCSCVQSNRRKSRYQCLPRFFFFLYTAVATCRDVVEERSEIVFVNLFGFVRFLPHVLGRGNAYLVSSGVRPRFSMTTFSLHATRLRSRKKNDSFHRTVLLIRRRKAFRFAVNCLKEDNKTCSSIFGMFTACPVASFALPFYLWATLSQNSTH